MWKICIFLIRMRLAESGDKPIWQSLIEHYR